MDHELYEVKGALSALIRMHLGPDERHTNCVTCVIYDEAVKLLNRLLKQRGDLDQVGQTLESAEQRTGR